MDITTAKACNELLCVKWLLSANRVELFDYTNWWQLVSSLKVIQIARSTHHVLLNTIEHFIGGYLAIGDFSTIAKQTLIAKANQ